MISTVLWPFAYKYVELFYNHLSLVKDGLSPAEKFSDAQVKVELKDFHTWGCPCYVLDSREQTGTMIPKWDPRSRLGIYVGHSPYHAGNVALVLNPRTMHVSPQFHLCLDDELTTVPFLAGDDIPPNWSELVSHSESVTPEDYDLAQHWIKATEDPKTPVLGQEGDVKHVSFDSEPVPAASEKHPSNLEGATAYSARSK